jgi:hypothetical protein
MMANSALETQPYGKKPPKTIRFGGFFYSCPDIL